MSELRILDLDGSLTAQDIPLSGRSFARVDALAWGPRIRLACPFRAFEAFRRWLGQAIPPTGPAVTLYGSGDFHHVTLALLERIPGPFHLLVLDKHPDWMRGIPFLHCGTWLRHALRLPNLGRVFHCGGELDFDNAYRWLAPWREILSGRVVVFPARRRFTRGRWASVRTEPLLEDGGDLAGRLGTLLDPFRAELASVPLYVTIDKDVLRAEDAAVNWDSGLLRLADAVTVLETFLAAAGGRLAGADLLGDWSPVVLGNPLARLCHRLDHPGPDHDPAEAAARKAAANAALLKCLLDDPDAPR